MSKETILYNLTCKCIVSIKHQPDLVSFELTYSYVCKANNKHHIMEIECLMGRRVAVTHTFGEHDLVTAGYLYEDNP